MLLSQLRVIRAFKSTLEDLEEKRSEHSIHSFRNSRSHSGGLRHSIPENILSHVDAGDSRVKSTSLHPHRSSAAMGSGDLKSAALLYADEHGRHHPHTAGNPERDRQRRTASNGHNNNNSHAGPVPYIAGGRYSGHSTNNYPHSYPYDTHQPSMNPSQMMAPYHPVTPQRNDSNLPPPPPPSSVLTIRLDYDSLPDLPADLPRLIHETSI